MREWGSPAHVEVFCTLSLIPSPPPALAASSLSVAIRFFLQSGAGVIPRSSKEEHLKENLEAFSYALTPDEMKELGWHEEL